MINFRSKSFANSVTRCWSYKVAQMLRKVAQNVATAVLHKVIFYKIAQKSPIFLGYFCKQIWCQEFLKIAQSGHTFRKAYENKMPLQLA